jgi:hypothetical protein
MDQLTNWFDKFDGKIFFTRALVALGIYLLVAFGLYDIPMIKIGVDMVLSQMQIARDDVGVVAATAVIGGLVDLWKYSQFKNKKTKEKE